MLRFLIIILLALPFVDLWVLLEIASFIGFWSTLAIVLLTGIIGAEIVRREIRFVLEKLGSSVTLGEVSRNFMETLLLLFSGLLLLTPGVITDIIGFMLAFRPFRERSVVRISERLKSSESLEVEVQRF